MYDPSIDVCYDSREAFAMTNEEFTAILDRMENGDE